MLLCMILQHCLLLEGGVTQVYTISPINLSQTGYPRLVHNNFRVYMLCSLRQAKSGINSAL